MALRSAGKRRATGTPFGEAGIALPVSLIIMFVVLILIMGVLTIGSQDASLARAEIRRTQALFAAESGVERAHTWLQAQSAPPAGTAEFYPLGADPVDLADGTYQVRVIPDSLNPSLAHPRYTIESVGTVDGYARQIEVVVSPEYFSNYLYFTDREHEPGSGNPLWFVTPDVIDGPMFTNDQISIMGDPTFMDCVFSAYGGPDDGVASHNPAFLYYNGDAHNNIESAAANNAPHDNPTFMDGYVLGDTEVDYPTHSLAFDMKELARVGGISIAGTYEIELGRTDESTGLPMYGYVSYRKAGKTWNDVLISSTNGVFFVNGSFSVSGVLDGELTLVTNGSVWITDDITYRASDANGPLPGCDDLLGVIAGTDVNVAWNDATSNDCVIHGALMGLDNCFRADSWNVGDPRGTLTVWGSIIQSYRGSVGTSYIDEFGNAVILTGYQKDYHYDWRLAEKLPPGFYDFMKTGVYKRLSWREVPVA